MLNLAYNVICIGTRLEDIERLRQDVAYMTVLPRCGVAHIPVLPAYHERQGREPARDRRLCQPTLRLGERHRADQKWRQRLARPLLNYVGYLVVTPQRIHLTRTPASVGHFQDTKLVLSREPTALRPIRVFKIKPQRPMLFWLVLLLAHRLLRLTSYIADSC